MYLETFNQRLTLRGPSSWRTRRPMLRFSPLHTRVEEVAMVTSPAPTSPPSVMSTCVETPLELQVKVTHTPHPPSMACHMPAIAVAHHGNTHERTPSLSASDDWISSTEVSEQRVTQPTLHPLSEDEVKHVEAAHKKYMESIEYPGSLVAFLQELTASNSVAEAEQWLKHLDIFLGSFIDETMENNIDDSVKVERKSGSHPRILSLKEAIDFFAWLKSSQGDLFRPPSPECASSLNTDCKKKSEVSDEGNEPYNNERSSTLCSPSPLPMAGEVRASGRTTSSISGRGRGSRTPRSRMRKKSELAVTSSRSYNLEQRAFAMLGGGMGGSGMVRLTDFKRMLTACSFYVDFNTYVGRVIDLNRTGRITFKEFLWMLECSVSGKVPAAAIRRFLAAPMIGVASSACAAIPHSSLGCQPSPKAKWMQGRLNHHVVLPSVRRVPSRREKALPKAKGCAGTNASLSQRKLLEELKQISSLNLLRLSPYADSSESEVLLGHLTRSRKHRHYKTASTRFVSTPSRSPSSREKSTGLLSARSKILDGKTSADHRCVTTN
ncbi:hypothetical protein TraAM80_07524 [Trypanosoma rangeli]|uniref:EF-hand domain-containing protein n=1 Tax=Trypanosoma rangeli TaxID=5698 RepID=A0A3R7NCB0_TRYRA|nr:uncharacterized protein TraAM80_07524 [Trypanosoma rangeli]RNF00523.1 hypothetical protein TraAM80_07524 [Trypanosoma rangeli]|eukprot:RNF00523.1 hypothetical protein TraAM80_07524 [Trypanosoma rangeli]